MAAVSHVQNWSLRLNLLHSCNGYLSSPEQSMFCYGRSQLPGNGSLMMGGIGSKLSMSSISNETGPVGSALSAATGPVASSNGTSGDYMVNSHEIITSPQSSYEVLELLGRGTFGQVLRCWKKDSNEAVALKILKNLPSYTKQGHVEVDVLSSLSKVDSEQFNFVRAYESFTHHGHICIVFECLQINLYDYLKHNRFQPLPLKHIRPVAQQVLTCLKKLGELGLVHADLKPENIMLVDPDRQPFRVKVIDFGSATCRSTGSSTTYLQSRYYRAPEVILGVAYDEAIDMWSLGCVLAELFLGWPLFPGATEYDQVCYISQMLGDPPSILTKNAAKMRKFYRKDGRRKWVLKPQAQFQLETGVCPKETRKFIFTSVPAIGQVTPCHHESSQPYAHDSAVAEHQDKLQFISFLEMLLTFDPAKRADPSSCLQHPFITMLHLAMQTSSMCVRQWIECMQVCCHSRTTHSSPPNSTSTATPITIPLQQPHLLYALDSTYMQSHTHQTHPPLVQLPSRWPSTDYCYRPVLGTNHSSLLVDTGYVSADSSPTSAYPLIDCHKIIGQAYHTPFFLPQNSPYWLMLQQSSCLVSRSRL